MTNEVNKIINGVFKEIFLFIEERKILSIIFILLVIIFGIPFVSYLQSVIKTIPYLQIISSIFWFLGHFFTPVEQIIFWISTISFVFSLYIYSRINKTSVVEDIFDNNLNKWNIPLGSSWTIEKIKNTHGKVLSIKNSYMPGTLKETYFWFDYELSFESKLRKLKNYKNLNNYNVVVRAKNNQNGIQIIFSQNKITFNLIIERIIIECETQLLTNSLPINEWLNTKIMVVGNIIEIYIKGQKIYFKIPNENLTVPQEKFDNKQFSNKPIKLSELKDWDNTRNDLFDKILNLFEQQRKNTNDEDIKKQIDDSMKEYRKATKNFTIEYPNGSVGFLHSNKTPAYFRNFKLKRKG